VRAQWILEESRQSWDRGFLGERTERHRVLGGRPRVERRVTCHTSDLVVKLAPPLHPRIANPNHRVLERPPQRNEVLDQLVGRRGALAIGEVPEEVGHRTAGIPRRRIPQKSIEELWGEARSGRREVGGRAGEGPIVGLARRRVAMEAAAGADRELGPPPVGVGVGPCRRIWRRARRRARAAVGRNRREHDRKGCQRQGRHGAQSHGDGNLRVFR
jgi:hypothetical protein